MSRMESRFRYGAVALELEVVRVDRWTIGLVLRGRVQLVLQNGVALSNSGRRGLQNGEEQVRLPLTRTMFPG